MRNLLLLPTFILAFSHTFSQETSKHSCALGHINHALSGGTKTLTAQQEGEANKYDVTYYQLDLAMSNLNTHIDGTCTMHANVLETMDSVFLELYPTLSISEIRYDGIPVLFNRNNTVLTVPCITSPGNDFTLEIDYSGIPPTPSNNPFGGSGVTNSYVSQIGTRVTWTVSCPFLAEEWFPCKQILRDKVDSSAVNITVPSNCKVGSNGTLEQVTDLGNGTVRYAWKNHHPILYYLISVSIAPYAEYNLYAHPVQLNGDSVLIQNYVYGSGSSLNTITAQCDLLPGFLEYYSDIYGLYPFSDEKYGQCIAPLSGGMEHQTMTTIGYFEKKTTAHELSHEWWGDHLGVASFADVAMSEGFATYSEYLMLEEFYPSEMASLLSTWANNVMTSPSGSVYCNDTLDINRIYNTRLTYYKGGFILHTLRNIINNDSLFFETLQNFQLAFHDGVVYGRDFRDFIENATGIDLHPFFSEWYYGQGYPQYSVRWNTLNNNLLIDIKQVASYSSVTPYFTNPIEISFSRNNLNDTIIRFSIQDTLNQFTLYNAGEITGVTAIDPANWVINKTGTIIHDSAYVLNIEELADYENWLVFPNPVTNSLTIKHNNTANTSVIQVEIYSLDGKVVKSIGLYPENVVPVSELAVGTYLLQIVSKDGKILHRQKLLKN